MSIEENTVKRFMMGVIDIVKCNGNLGETIEEQFESLTLLWENTLEESEFAPDYGTMGFEFDSELVTLAKKYGIPATAYEGV